MRHDALRVRAGEASWWSCWAGRRRRARPDGRPARQLPALRPPPPGAERQLGCECGRMAHACRDRPRARGNRRLPPAPQQWSRAPRCSGRSPRRAPLGRERAARRVRPASLAARLDLDARPCSGPVARAPTRRVARGRRHRASPAPDRLRAARRLLRPPPLLGGTLADAVGGEHSWAYQVGSALNEGTEVAGWLTVGLGCCRNACRRPLSGRSSPTPDHPQSEVDVLARGIGSPRGLPIRTASWWEPHPLPQRDAFRTAAP